MMNRTTVTVLRTASGTLLAASLVALTACASDKKDSNVLTGEHTSTLTVQPGEAGGVMVDTFTATASVTAIDKPTRKVTLTGDDGSSTTFIASPEVRNFDQLKVGDRVTASIMQEIVVFARRGDSAPSSDAAVVAARAAQGAKPGVMAAGTVEIVGRIWAIDTADRKVDVVFADGQHKIVTPRADVDLSRYRVGDSLVVQMTQTLTVLVVGK